MSTKSADDSLITNLHQQLHRLMEQLADIETERSSLEEDEYKELREDTVTQLEDLNKTMAKMAEGNISLIDDLSAARFAIQAAITAAFRTPEVVALFIKKQPLALRQRLAALDADFRLGRIPKNEYTSGKREVLLALQKLRDTLSPLELSFLAETETEEPQFDLSDAPASRICSEAVINQ